MTATSRRKRNGRTPEWQANHIEPNASKIIEDPRSALEPCPAILAAISNEEAEESAR